MRTVPVSYLQSVLRPGIQFYFYSKEALTTDDEIIVKKCRQSMIDEVANLEASQRIRLCCYIALCCWRLEEKQLVKEWLKKGAEEVFGFEDIFGEELRGLAIMAYTADFHELSYQVIEKIDDVWAQVALRDIARLASRNCDFTTMFKCLDKMSRKYEWFDGVGYCLGELARSISQTEYAELLDMLEAEAKKQRRKTEYTDLRTPIVQMVLNDKADDAERIFQHAGPLDRDYACLDRGSESVSCRRNYHRHFHARP